MEEIVEENYKKIATIEKSSIAKTVGNMAFHREFRSDGLSDRSKNRRYCKLYCRKKKYFKYIRS